MKAIVEQYAKGGFIIDRPDVVISESSFDISIEAGTVYEDSFVVESRNNYRIKGMVYDSRYMLRFENHNFISRKFVVRYSFDATCLDAGQNFHGHINVITDGGEYHLPYEISIVEPCVKYHDERIDDLFKFAALAERNWADAAKLFINDDFKRTFINRDKRIKSIYDSLLESRSVDQAMEEFLVLVSKKRTVTLSVSKAKLEVAMPTQTECTKISVTKNTWGYTYSEVRSDSEFIIPSKKSLTQHDFTANVCELPVYISPEHVPEGENSGKLIIENIYQKIEVEIHLTKPEAARPNQENRRKRRDYKQNRASLIRNYLDFRMDRIQLHEYVTKSIDAFQELAEIEPENNIYRLGIMHMNILNGDYSKVEQEFLRIEADVDKSTLGSEQRSYYEYLRCMMLRDDEETEKVAALIRKNYLTLEPKVFYFWLLLFLDPVFNEDKNALYKELSDMFNAGENSPVVYFEFCNALNANPMMLKKLTPFEITSIKWGLRHQFISDDVLLEFVKLAGKNKDFNKQIFDVLRQIYDKNESELRIERARITEERGSGIHSGGRIYDIPLRENSGDLSNDLASEKNEGTEGETSGYYSDGLSYTADNSDENISDVTDDISSDYNGDEKTNHTEQRTAADTDLYAADDNDADEDSGDSDFDELIVNIAHEKTKADIAPWEEEDTLTESDRRALEADLRREEEERNALYRTADAAGIENRDDRLDAAVRAEEAEKLTRKESENIEVLSSICSMLISANMLEHKYHRFYRAAVLKSLKFIGLNECYIRSMNRQKYELVPSSVLMYLNYKNTLTEDELAYLYANVIYNKSEHMKIYHEYAPAMEDFMENMIMKGKVNDDLSVLYDEFLNPENVSSMYAGKLINIIFRRKIVCVNPNVRAVIVSHEELKNVQRVPLVNGEAYVEILSPNASVVFEDNYGNRYAGSIPYHFERIVDENAYIPICREYSPRDYRVLLYNYKNIGEFTYKDASEVNAARAILHNEEISYDFKQQAILAIIEYYHENLDMDVLTKYLGQVDIEYLSHASARSVITYLIDMNMFDKAFACVKLYGFNELDVNELYRLADYGVQGADGFINEDLMSICINLYKTGTVNPNILSYLAVNFKGSLDELSSLFKLCKGRVPEIGTLAENTLAQMMFENSHLEYIYDIFLTYYNGRSRGLVVKAFLRLSAHSYLVNDTQVPNFVFEAMFQEVQRGDIDDEISSMALLLYFSKLERSTDAEKKWIIDTVEKFVDAGKILPFFKKFSSFIRLPQDIFLKTYLIYKTENVRDVFVKYSFDMGTRVKQKTKRHRLDEVVAGVYSMEFVVFHGERLVYSIEDDPNGNAKIEESDVLKKTTFTAGQMNRFEQINNMLVKQEMREDSELLENLEVYFNTIHLFETNLKLL